MIDAVLRDLVALIFLIVGVPLAVLGLGFIFNVRGVGVTYVLWYRENCAWTRGIRALHTPAATRLVAAAIGIFWFVCDGGIVVVTVPALLK